MNQDKIEHRRRVLLVRWEEWERMGPHADVEKVEAAWEAVCAARESLNEVLPEGNRLPTCRGTQK